VQIAVNTVLEPTAGDTLVEASEHETLPGGNAPACQERLIPAGALMAEPLLALIK
jgi:hypothetical protein